MRQAVIFLSLLMLVALASMSMWQITEAKKEFRAETSFMSPQPTLSPREMVDDRLIPRRIIIPSLKVDLEIKEASVSGNEWVVYDDAASWLNTSGVINGGNMVVYAHNRRKLFEQLRFLDLKDEIIVVSDTKRALFKVTKAFEGLATDVQHVNQDETRLTLYTCSGPFDRYRYFIFGELVMIESV